MRCFGISTILMLSMLTTTTFGQTRDARQLLLNWEKLQQLREILDNMRRGYKILDQGYTTIRNVAEGNYSLHQLFLDGLMLVNPSVKNYKRITMIIDYQKRLIDEYKRAYTRFRKDPHFSAEEVAYLSRVYGNLFDASMKNIDELMIIITAAKLRMSDDERMAAIDRIYLEMEDKLAFLRTFNNSTKILAIQRAKAVHDSKTMEKLYDIN